MKRKPIIERLLIFGALIFVILTSGCATTRMYTGEELQKGEIALIKAASTKTSLTGYDVIVTIVAIDHKEVRKPSYKYEILPGLHQVTVKVFAYQIVWGLFGPAPWPGPEIWFLYDLEFNAEAGHEYRIKAVDIWKKNSFLIIVDTYSDKEVLKKRIE